jgi:hypothetical protein
VAGDFYKSITFQVHGLVMTEYSIDISRKKHEGGEKRSS